MRAWLRNRRGELESRRRLAQLRRDGVWIAQDSVQVSPDSRVARGARLAHHVSVRSSTIGPHTSVGRFSKLAFVDLGPFCSIAWDTTLGAVGHPTDRLSTHAFPYVPEAGRFVTERDQHVTRSRFGGDVWVGCNAVTMPGIEIGPGAMIAASAVVTRDVEPYTVVAGIPARPIKLRVPEPWVERLLALRWWDWSDETLRENVELFKAPLDEDLLGRLEDVGQPREPVRA